MRKRGRGVNFFAFFFVKSLAVWYIVAFGDLYVMINVPIPVVSRGHAHAALLSYLSHTPPPLFLFQSLPRSKQDIAAKLTKHVTRRHF